MIQLPNRQVQWDSDLGTFRGQVNGLTVGTHGGQFIRAEAWAAAASVELTQAQIDVLSAERDASSPGAPVVLSPSDFLRLIPDAEIEALLAARKQSVSVER